MNSNLLCLYVIIFIQMQMIFSQLERDRSIVIKEPFYKDPDFFPKNITDEYASYTTLSNHEETCDMLNVFITYPDLIKQKVKETRCVPNVKTLQFLLDEGYIDEVSYLIENVYLPNEVDPSEIVKAWISKVEALKKNVNQYKDSINYKKISHKFGFINKDDSVLLVIKLNEADYVAEKIDVFCYRNLLIVNLIFQKKGEMYSIIEEKRLYDEVEECHSNYNSFTSEVEVTMKKKFKLKKWDNLFKK